MTAILVSLDQIRLHAASTYPTSDNHAIAMGLTGKKNEEVRALTIAAFRIAQNNQQLSQALMNHDLLLFLLAGSGTALKYWIGKGRLIGVSRGYKLTSEGLAECQNSLLGLAGAYSTTENKVAEWQERMLRGDAVAQKSRQFDGRYWCMV